MLESLHICHHQDLPNTDSDNGESEISMEARMQPKFILQKNTFFNHWVAK